MIVARITHLVKPECTAAAVALLKEFREHPAERNQVQRIYTSSFGPRHTVIWEGEHENLAALAKAWAEWPSHPMADTFWERFNKLVVSGGSTEIWDLE